MKFDEDKDEIVFESTNRREYAFNGLLSIGTDDGGKQSVYYGHDGSLSDYEWSAVEREEMAAYMIARWGKFGGENMARCAASPCDIIRGVNAERARICDLADKYLAADQAKILIDAMHGEIPK